MDLSRDDLISRLRDLSLCLNNRDDIGIEQQVQRLTADEPAYWYRGQTSGATWVVELACCPEHNRSFLKALEVFVSRKPSIDVVEDILDNVIPLNEQAVIELQLAYRLQSTFREEEALAARERKAIFDPYFMPRMDAATRAVWAAKYEQCQTRFEARQMGISPKVSLALALSAVAADDVARVAVEGVQADEVAA